jgi:hypothetical protein
LTREARHVRRHLKRWNLSMGEGQPLAVIAGMNVLENLDLALEVGRELKAITAAGPALCVQGQLRQGQPLVDHQLSRPRA